MAGMDDFNLFCAFLSPRFCEKLDLTGSDAVLRSDPTQVEQDLAIRGLNPIAVEHTDGSVAVGKEFVRLRANDCVIVGVKGGTHRLKAIKSSFHKVFSRLA